MTVCLILDEVTRDAQYFRFTGLPGVAVRRTSQSGEQFHRAPVRRCSKAGDYEVDSEGERRRMLDVYTLRYRDFEAGMIGMAACAALDNVTKQAMFSCETQLNRWSVLDFFCAKVLSFSKLPFGLGSFAFNVRVETDCMEFLKISSA